MQDLINQLSAATNGKPITYWQPVVIARGDCSYHIQIVKRATIADREGFIKEFYRLQANGKMVMGHSAWAKAAAASLSGDRCILQRSELQDDSACPGGCPRIYA